MYFFIGQSVLCRNLPLEVQILVFLHLGLLPAELVCNAIVIASFIGNTFCHRASMYFYCSTGKQSIPYSTRTLFLPAPIFNWKTIIE